MDVCGPSPCVPTGVTSGRTTITAEVPQSEITRYAIDLRSVSHGTAMFSRSHLGYEPMPPNLVKDHLPG